MRGPQHPMVDWEALRQDRVRRLRALAEKRGLDALLLVMFDNVRFATGMGMAYLELAYEGQLCLVAASGDTCVFSTNGTSVEPLADPDPMWPHVRELVSLPAIYPLVSIADRVAEVVATKITAWKARRVGFDSIPAALHVRLAAALGGGVELMDVQEDLFSMRSVKHAEELVLMQANADRASAAMRAAKRAIREGACESDIAAVAASELYRGGETEMISHIVVSGDPPKLAWGGSRSPTGDPDVRALHRRGAGSRPVLDGELCRIDLGHYGLGGYCTDLERTAAAGRVAREVEAAYQEFVDIYLAVADGLRDGVRIWDHVTHSTEMLIAAGFVWEGALGHGIGLRCTEPPSLSHERLGLKGEQFSAAMYKAGSVLCLEIHPTTREGYRFSLEDMFLITTHKPLCLTTVDYLL